MPYFLDGKIDLDQICKDADWHLATAVDRLKELGFSRAEAEAFAEFAFNEHAQVTDLASEDLVTDEQWARISFTA
ncbi:MAG: hypothetical protein KKB70_12275 [Proteobacteria bacterium]|nr:hypothetical protein [Pseudomonadota bacterium]